MRPAFPKLPDYRFSWRSLQIEPIPMSGERITLGIILKGEDQALLGAKLVAGTRLKKMYGPEFGSSINDALSLCTDYAEKYYKTNPLSNVWAPPLEGFYLGELQSSLAENIEDALLQSAKYCSAFSLAALGKKDAGTTRLETTAPEYWRKLIFEAVTGRRADFASYFDRDVTVRGYGVPLKFGFLSEQYAAQFDAIIEAKNLQHGLVRAQSKLWQLDRLRDENALFPPEFCELVLQTPKIRDEKNHCAVQELVEELRYEASKRELAIYATDSPTEAAQHVIDRAA